MSSNTPALEFQVGPNSWIRVPIEPDNVRYISFACDWRDGSYSLHVNGEPVFARLKQTEYPSVKAAIEGEEL